MNTQITLKVLGGIQKCLESWWKYSDDQFKVELELSKKEKKELSDFL